MDLFTKSKPVKDNYIEKKIKKIPKIRAPSVEPYMDNMDISFSDPTEK